MCVSPRKPSCDILALHVAMLFFTRILLNLFKTKHFRNTRLDKKHISSLCLEFGKSVSMHNITGSVKDRLKNKNNLLTKYT